MGIDDGGSLLRWALIVVGIGALERVQWLLADWTGAQHMARRLSSIHTRRDDSDLGRFATRGAVDTLFVDIDTTVPGRVDELGEVTFSAPAAASSGDVVDELARRAWLSGTRLSA